MRGAFEKLLEDRGYRTWFQEWWVTDYSVEGCESKGLDWTVGGRFRTPVEFAGRMWGFCWLPPHDLDGQLNDAFFSAARFDWSAHIAKLLSHQPSGVRFDGAWLESLALNGVRALGRLSGSDAFILNNLQLDSSSLEFGLRGAFVGGATHLIHLELRGRSVLTESRLRGDLVARRIAESALHLNKTRIGGSVRLSEPSLQIDLSQAQIAGDLVWGTELARLDARQVIVFGAMRFAAHGGTSEWGRFDNSQIAGEVTLDTPHIQELSLRHATISGPLIFRNGNVGILRATRIRLKSALEIIQTNFQELDLSSAEFYGPMKLEGVISSELRLRRARVASTASVDGDFNLIEANALHCTTHADFSGSLIRHEARFTQAEFQGPVSFARTGFQGRASFLKAAFRAGADFSADVGGQEGRESFGPISFQAAIFSAAPGSLWCATFDGRRFNGLTIFDGSTFIGIPRFYEVEFHEDVSLRHARFRRRPGRSWQHRLGALRRHRTLSVALRASLNTWNKTQQQYENAYRALKMRMSEVGASRDEHRFLVLELRARRWRYDPEVRPLESALSLLYDLTSSYGESIWRPIAATMLLVAVSGTLVYQATPVEVGWERSLEFALQQVFRPFNVWGDKGDVILVAERSGLDEFFGASGKDIKASPWLKLVASVQSLGCLTLLFLAALAVRRRFRLG